MLFLQVLLHLCAGIMLVYLMCLRGFVTVMTYLLPSRYLSLGLVGLATTATSLVAGFSLHHDDIPVWLFWRRSVLNENPDPNCFSLHHDDIPISYKRESVSKLILSALRRHSRLQRIRIIKDKCRIRTRDLCLRCLVRYI